MALPYLTVLIGVPVSTQLGDAGKYFSTLKRDLCISLALNEQGLVNANDLHLIAH